MERERCGVFLSQLSLLNEMALKMMTALLIEWELCRLSHINTVSLRITAAAMEKPTKIQEIILIIS